MKTRDAARGGVSLDRWEEDRTSCPRVFLSAPPRDDNCFEETPISIHAVGDACLYPIGFAGAKNELASTAGQVRPK